jgi:ABA4-like protein
LININKLVLWHHLNIYQLHFSEVGGDLPLKSPTMTNDKLFSLAGMVAMIGWIVLIMMPFWKQRDQYVFGLPVVLLAILYSFLIFGGFDSNTLKNFGSLDGVATLFSNKAMLLAGWIHYLAFDLFTGIYIVRNARTNGINHWLTLPALLLTFLFGPFGLLLYFVTRVVKSRKYLDDQP